MPRSERRCDLKSSAKIATRGRPEKRFEPGARLDHDQGLSSAAFHPGGVATNFGAESTSFFRPLYQSRIGKMVLATPEKGASQLVRFARTKPGVDWQSGAYYEGGRVARRVHPQVRDADLARQLWNRSAELVGVAAG